MVGGMSQPAKKTKEQAGTCKDYTLIMWKLDTDTRASAACSLTTSTVGLPVCVCGVVFLCISSRLWEETGEPGENPRTHGENMRVSLTPGMSHTQTPPTASPLPTSSPD
ncbi:hypothetical protein JOB18_039169 [Solea senegalensis]|uniref:Uncharacterized protein n=1 Tax=Solea senegalensis TaxID=28829 RepID=A0AAV6R6P4_SOLSE|nr:hypothetical protein JOB18_039169 [Solea senegalensis]